MSRVVETGRRAYASPLREAQARETRRAVVDAAARLFVEHGYAGTTIDLVAAEAWVSRKTVFSSVGGKARLLEVAWDWALVGDDEPVAMSDRPEVHALEAEADPERLVERWAAFVADISARIAPLHPVLRAAADVDAEAAQVDAVSTRNRELGARMFVDRLAAVGGLRGDLTLERATHVAFVLMDPSPYDELVRSRGWAHQDYVDWLARLARASFRP
jgi:AcrR family transcriptional regulator